MSFLSIGDLSGNLRLRALNTDMRRQANQLSAELSSGKSSDISARLDGGLGQLGAIQRALQLSESYRTNAVTNATVASSMQVALDELQQEATDVGNRLLLGANNPGREGLEQAAKSAVRALEHSISALNSRIGERSLFAGVETDKPALASADDLIAAVKIAAAAATTAVDAQTAIDAFFEPPSGGFDSAILLGSSTPSGAVHLSEGEVVQIGITASDGAIRNHLKALTTAALVADGLFASDQDAQAELIGQAGETLLSTKSGLAALQAELGGLEERIEKATVSNATQAAVLHRALQRIEGIDLYETTTELQSVETRLELLYASTARMSQMSLVRYLR